MTANFHTTYKKLLSLNNLQVSNYTDSPKELARSLKRVKSLLNRLGDPQKKLEIIHIAGTSGKGSVVNYLHEILRADGRSVASYTSPHTTSYLERFRVGDKLIDPKILIACIDELFEAYQKMLADEPDELSFFELSTVLAFFAFHRAGAEWCVLETGCGGRSDATNIIPTPRVAVITNIDKDHTEILGTALTDIAYEKAGIIKKGGVVFCGETRPVLKKVFMKEAVEKDAALFFVNPPSAKKVPNKYGRHQQHNAALAEAAALEVGVAPEVIVNSLQTTIPLPCRFEAIQTKPLIILDGAHNLAKIKTTVDLIKALNQPVHVVFGCTATKDAAGMLKLLSPVAKTITTTRFATNFRKVANPATLLASVPKAKRAGFFLDHAEALIYAKKIAKSSPIVITGSLYLAGEMRAAWVSEDEILAKHSSFPLTK
jgi:dihydrofolate synthase/folylpolyglutamate synthase